MLNIITHITVYITINSYNDYSIVTELWGPCWGSAAHRWCLLHHWSLHLHVLRLGILVNILNRLIPLALLAVEHFVALDVAKIAHVADVSEGEVVVEASLASPVTDSLLNFLGRSRGGFGGTAWFLLAWLIGINIALSFHFLQETLLFSLGSLSWWHSQMLWHTFAVIIGLSFLASVALLSAFKVVVLALAALPSTIWELEVAFSSLLEGLTLWNEWLNVVQVEVGLMEWLDTTCRSGHLSKLVHLGDGWHLSLLLELLERWEVELWSWEVLLDGGVVSLEGLVRVASFDGWWHVLR